MDLGIYKIIIYIKKIVEVETTNPRMGALRVQTGDYFALYRKFKNYVIKPPSAFD
jgi:hypothetical protein